MENTKISIEKLAKEKISFDKLSLVLLFHLIDIIKLDNQIIKCQNQLKVCSVHMRSKTEKTLNDLKANKETLKHNLETFLLDVSFNSICDAFEDDDSIRQAKETNDPRKISDALYTKSIKIMKEILDNIKVDAENISEERGNADERNDG